MAELKIGEISKPRFEFRSFGQCFCNAHKRMARLSVPVPEKVWERSSDEIYIISAKNDINNTKIRDGKMDIKTYVQTVDGLEQWNPLMKGEFPISREVLEKEVFPAFMVEMPKLTKDTYTFEEFMKLADLATTAVETSIPGAKAYFTNPDKVSETTHRVYFYEKEAVKLAQSIKRTVFHDMQLKLSEKFHLRYFALHIEDLSTAAVKVAEQLSVMAIKRGL